MAYRKAVGGWRRKSAELWRLLGAEALVLKRWDEAEHCLGTALRADGRRTGASWRSWRRRCTGPGKLAELDAMLERALAAGAGAMTV